MKRISFFIGNKPIGNDSPCLIQSMSDIKTEFIQENIDLTESLAKKGLDLMRFSVLDENDALALQKIKKHVSIPIIADIHYNYHFAIQSVLSGVDKIRINPGNIGTRENLIEVIRLCKEHNVPIRIGINSGSLNKFHGKGKDECEDIFLAMDETLSIFQSESFDKIVLSLKSSNPFLTKILYEKAYERYPYPLHIGLTESGFSTVGAMRSTMALAPLLNEGIGDTIRISLADDRNEELRACKELLRLTNRRFNTPELIVCPGCGRTLIPLKEVSRIVQNHLDFVSKHIKVAVMGCPVNGLGEAKDADLGIAGSGRQDIFLVFSKGKEIGYFEKSQALSLLFQLIDEF